MDSCKMRKLLELHMELKRENFKKFKLLKILRNISNNKIK